MGTMLASLLDLQTIEKQLAHVRGRLRARKNAVAVQQRRIDQLTADFKALHDKSISRRKDADGLELDLRQREQEVAKFRAALNTAKTNKDYSAILTQINTLKADNSKIEEQVLKIMQEVDAVKGDSDKIQEQMKVEEARMAEVDKASGDEIKRLTAMMEDLSAKRAQAAAVVPPDPLAAFERIAAKYDGEAMALVEIQGKRPPHDYVCGGCFMTLNAEHANILRIRDQIRTCDNCGRILYLESAVQKTAK